MKKGNENTIGRIKSILIILGLTLGLVSLRGNSAKAEKSLIVTSYNVEQAQGKAPVVRAYVNGSKVKKTTEFSAIVTGDDISGKIKLETESVEKFADFSEGIDYKILLDNSMSVDEKQFAQVKKELVELRKNLSKKDRMELYAVGSNKAKGEAEKIITAKGKKSVSQEVEAICNIRRTKKRTVLYRSLTKVLEETDNNTMRTIVLVITDGEDDSQGKNNRTYQVNLAVKSSRVPVYGILLKNISQNPNKEKMNNTRKYILEEKQSRGYYEDCSTVQDVVSGFKNIQDILFQQTYVVTLREENNSNKTTTNARLCLLCNEDEVTLKNGTFTYNQIGEEDDTAPVISDIKKTADNRISFTLRDDKTKLVHGADEIDNYTVKSKKDSGKERVWLIKKINKTAEDDCYELVFEEELYTGDYIITCSGIYDDSQEKNIMTESYEFHFDGLSAQAEGAKHFIKTYWWMILIVLVLIFGIIIVLLLRRRGKQTLELNTEELLQSDSGLLCITVTDKNGDVQDLEWNVEGSIFVGRSDICNVFFADDLLSKQHFVMEITKMGCYLEDLQTTNGTFVNGVKLTGRRKLSVGDVILAGREQFVIRSIEKHGCK